MPLRKANRRRWSSWVYASESPSPPSELALQRPHRGHRVAFLDPARMDDGHGWSGAVADYINFVRSRPPAKGVESVLVPGDPERARRKDRLANGLPLSSGVWESILSTGENLGLTRSDLEALARKTS